MDCHRQYPGSRIRYARVAPHTTAGSVTVTLNQADEQIKVTVTYELTALTQAAAAQLREFADNYPTFLATWQHAITRALHTEAP